MKSAGSGIPKPRGPKVGGNPQNVPHGTPKAVGKSVGQRPTKTTKGNVR